MTNWKDELEKYNDNFEAINIEGKMYLGNKVKSALRVLSREFNSESYGNTEGASFFAWSRDWIYFCIDYDGFERIERISRDPSKEKVKHIGINNVC